MNKKFQNNTMSLTTSNTNCAELHSEFQKSVLDGNAPLGMNGVTTEIESHNDVVLDSIFFTTTIQYNPKDFRKLLKFCDNYKDDIVLGVSNLKFYKKNLSDILTFMVSAKLLKESYFDGITKNNYKEVIDKIISILPVDIFRDNLLVYGLHSRIDVVTSNAYKNMSLIQRLNYNDDLYNKTKYQKVANNGVIYSKTNNTKNRRLSLSIYNKENEFLWIGMLN